MIPETSPLPPKDGDPREAEANTDGSKRAAQALESPSCGSNGPESQSDDVHSEQNGKSPTGDKIPLYQITRKSDNLAIAVWSDAEHSMPSAEGEPMTGAIEDSDHYRSNQHNMNVRDPRTLTLMHENGDRYDIPWALCLKWTWMKDIIKLTYGPDEASKTKIDESKFRLYRADLIILPEHWDIIVRPWQLVTIRLARDSKPTKSTKNERKHLRKSKRMGILPPLPPPPPPPPLYNFRKTYSTNSSETDATDTESEEKDPMDTDGIKPVYQVGVKYKIEFYVRDQFGPEKTFLGSKMYDDPVELEKSSSRDQSIPVIEEINRITFGSEKNTWQMNRHSKRGLALDAEDRVSPKKLHVRSPLLLNALRSIVKYSSNPPPGDETEVFKNGLFQFPFSDLYHHRQELLDFKNETSGARANHTPEYNAECDEHIDVLVDYLDKEPTIQLKTVKERWAQKIPVTTFADFWLLMKPGADVYVQENGQLNAYVVDLVSGGMKHEHWSFNARSYRVRVWHLVFNSKVIKRRSKTIEVPVFDGEREITSLPLFPTSFHDELDNGALKKQLVERGRKFFQFAKGPTFLEYTGMGLKPGWKKYNQARVVVEHQSLPWDLDEFRAAFTWNLTNDEVQPMPRNPRYPPPPGMGLDEAGLGERARVPRCECSRCRIVDSREGTSISPTFSDYDSIDPSRANGLSEHQALVSMSHMFGFILKDRAYDILDLNGLTEPKLAESAIDQLVLRPEKNKETIKSIARTYTESESQADLFSVDFIRGKGEGQIFLLHGPPGTGKTLTAESVAEYTKRPLLSITAADLGHDPIELEHNLLRFFKNATAWDAIVLLDEADVYLERRSSNDLRRNSIVSIFLRALDYFEGILFFTTNRVGQFDEAFMSRIHVSIGYDPLDDKAREQVWDTLFRKLKENHKSGGPQIDYEYDAKQYVRRSEEVKRLHWNGREIRNAFQTAVALAIADSKTARRKGRPEEDCVPQVTEAHLRQVVEMSAAFKRYIKATHEDMNDSDLAFRLGNRHDQAIPENA